MYSTTVPARGSTTRIPSGAFLPGKGLSTMTIQSRILTPTTLEGTKTLSKKKQLSNIGRSRKLFEQRE
ncbi:hypothetical protein B0T12DRAFT_422342 [Alternaria alternata]|nr:hypothetical protein B0T12DRAFT_422342 [Alternaria alternata]